MTALGCIVTGSCGGVLYRQARYCDGGTVAPVAMTATDAATFPNALFIPGVGCLYFNFADPTYNSPPAGTILYAAGDATSQASCAACDGTCTCAQLPGTLYVRLANTSSWAWVPGTATPCSPSVAYVPVIQDGGNPCRFVSAGEYCIGGGLVTVVVATSGGIKAATFVPDAGPFTTFTAVSNGDCDIFGDIPFDSSGGGSTPSVPTVNVAGA